MGLDEPDVAGRQELLLGFGGGGTLAGVEQFMRTEGRHMSTAVCSRDSALRSSDCHGGG